MSTIVDCALTVMVLATITTRASIKFLIFMYLFFSITLV